MPGDDLLLEAWKATRTRLEAELTLHWQRIQIATVGIVGLMTAVGWLAAQNDMPGEKQTCLLLISGMLGAVLCVYTFILARSGKYWIKVNEEKVDSIEQELFHASIYRHEKRPCDPFSLSKATCILIASLGLMFAAVVVAAISRMLSEILPFSMPLLSCFGLVVGMTILVMIVGGMLLLIARQCFSICCRERKCSSDCSDSSVDRCFKASLSRIPRGCCKQ